MTTRSTASSTRRDAVAFIEKVLGLDLRQFQRDWLTELFREKDGKRVYTRALWGQPRGNGKSHMAAAVAGYMLLADRPKDGRPPQIVIAAGSWQQGMITFKRLREFIEGSALANMVTVLSGRGFMRIKGGAELFVVSADGPLTHGLEPTCIVFDEVWNQRKRELYEALIGGMIKRPEPVMVAISSAGYNADSLLWEMCKEGEQDDNPRYFYQWHSAPEDAPYDDPETWKLANPAMACERPFLESSNLQDSLSAMHESEFRRWHLGQWTAGAEAWINAPLWDSCNAKPQLKPDRATILGVDASIRHDSTVVATVQKDETGTYHTEFKVWEPTAGREVQMDHVVEHIRQQCLAYNVTGVCYDPYFMHHAAQILEDEGVTMIEWKQDNAQPLDEPVLTPFGWRAIGSLGVGDEVIGGDGHPTRVVAVNDRGAWPVHEVFFTDGAMTRCTAGHLWLTASPTQRYLGSPGTVRSLSEIQDFGLTRGVVSNCFVPLVTAQLAERSFPVEPYTLGVLLSDGHFGHTVTLSCSDVAIVDRVSSVLPPGMAVKTRQGQWHTLSSGAGCKSNPLTEGLRQVGVWGLRAWEKFVPEQYLLGSPDQRLALLQGLMDGDGTVSGSTASFHTTSTGLRDGVVALARSLGGTGRATALRCYSPGRRPAWRVTVSLPKSLSPFGLPRKADAHRRQYPPHRAMSGIREVGTLPVCCITVAAEDGLYVTRDYVVTHNSRMVPATRTLHEAIVNGKMRHGGHVQARSHALAAGVYETERGLRIKKTAGSGPNDALVALAMAVEWASRVETERRSIYEDRGVLTATA